MDRVARTEGLLTAHSAGPPTPMYTPTHTQIHTLDLALPGQRLTDAALAAFGGLVFASANALGAVSTVVLPVVVLVLLLVLIIGLRKR